MKAPARPSNHLERRLLQIFTEELKLVCIKIWAHISLERPLEYTNFVITFLKLLGNYRNVMQLEISSRRENK